MYLHSQSQFVEDACKTVSFILLTPSFRFHMSRMCAAYEIQIVWHYAHLARICEIKNKKCYRDVWGHGRYG